MAAAWNRSRIRAGSLHSRSFRRTARRWCFVPTWTRRKSTSSTSSLRGGNKGAGEVAKVLAVALLLSTLASGATLKYWVENCAAAESGCRTSDPELAEWAMRAWQTASGGRLTLERTADREKAHIRIYWANGRDGLYGETRPIVVEGVRGAEVYVLAPAANAYGSDALLRETVLYLTCLHEAGHSLG